MTVKRQSEKLETIIKDTTKFSLASYLANIFDFFSGIVTRSILGPLTMGVFAELMLIFQYAKYYHLGTYEALDREIPYFNGRQDFHRVKEIKGVAFNFSFLISVIFGISLVIISNFLKDNKLIFGLRFIAILVMLQSMVTFFIIVARTHHKFSLLSRYNLFFSLTASILSIILVIKFGLNGALYALILTNILAILFFLKNGFHLEFKLHQNWREIGRLLGIGLPILLYGIIFTTLLSIDRFMIIAFLGRVDLGYYSIATMVTGYLILIPNLIYTVLFPRFYEAFGREGSVEKLEFQFLTPMLIIAYLLPLPIGITSIALPLLIKYFLPQYWPGLIPAYILLIATFFVSILGMSNYLLIALNKQMRMVVLGAGTVIIGILVNYCLVVKMGLGLKGIALSMLVTYFLYSILMVGFAFSHYTKIIFKHITLFIKLYLPIVFIASVLYGLHSVFTNRDLSLKVDICNLLIQLVIFFIAYLPLFYYINSKTNIISKVMQLIRSKLAI